MWLLELRSFRTKKRSSDSTSWVAWSSILALTVVLGAVFTATQLAGMSQASVKFLNVRVPTIEDFQEKMDKRDVVMNEKSPFVHVGNDYVTIGSVKAVLSPRPGGDVVLIKKTENWKAEFSKAVLKWKKAKDVFPSLVFAFAYEEAGTAADQMNTVQSIVLGIDEINKELSKDSKEALTPPIPVFVGFAAQKLASGQNSNKP